MNIELSDQTSKTIQAAFGSSAQSVITQLIERIASDEQLLLSLSLHSPTESDIEAIREAIEEADAGLGSPFVDFDREFRKEMGFAL